MTCMGMATYTRFFIIDVRDCEVVTACEGEYLASVTERGTHHDCLVPILLVVVEDAGDR